MVEACTLCDMCFMTKCPYVPPHPFMLDFPHLMLRHRFVAAKTGSNNAEFTQKQLAEMDRNGTLARLVSPVINWASDIDNKPARAAMEKVAGIDRNATLPKFYSRTFVSAQARPIPFIPMRPDLRMPSARLRSMPPASSITTSRPPAWRHAPF